MAQEEHNVLIEPHGRTLRVAAEQPVLEAALAAGLNLPHSCKSGHCSSCRARLLTGEIRYPGGRPLGLSLDEERSGHVLLCQARALSDLVVEARLIARVADVEIKTLPCRIARLTPLAADVMQVMLRLPAVERLRFHPGQYLDVLLPARLVGDDLGLHLLDDHRRAPGALLLAAEDVVVEQDDALGFRAPSSARSAARAV